VNEAETGSLGQFSLKLRSGVSEWTLESVNFAPTSRVPDNFSGSRVAPLELSADFGRFSRLKSLGRVIRTLFWRSP
jgi:hypothetical protein